MFGHKWFLKMGELSDASLPALINNACELINCNYYFYQGIDGKGQAQELVRAGVIKFTIPTAADRTLNQWMLRSDLLKNGVFVFKRGEQNSPLKIEFDEGYCVNMANRTAGGKGMSTEFSISANEVRMNGKSCCNYFKL